MVINKLDIERIPLMNIYEISVPSFSQYKYMCPVIEDAWWLRKYTSLTHGGAYIINEHDIQLFVDKTNVYGVRPLIRFKGFNLDIHIGDRLIWADHLFSVIDGGMAVCYSIIGHSPYCKTGNNATTFEESDLYNFLQEWKNKNINMPVFKITDSQTLFVRAEFSALSKTDAFNAHFTTNDSNRYPFWIKGRKNEFTGYLANIKHKNNHKFLEAPLTEKHYIYPALYFTDGTLCREFQCDKYFEYNGKLFEPFDKERGIALSLNCIGTSCYSTGIASFDECSEDEFFEDSELRQEIDSWAYDLPF